VKERFLLTDEIADKLKTAIKGEKKYFTDEIKNRRCQLWEFIKDTFVITRLEVDKNSNEKTLVVCCYEGQRVCLFTTLLIEFCMSQEIDFIRFHTSFKKLGRVMQHKFIFNKISESESESVYLLRV